MATRIFTARPHLYPRQNCERRHDEDLWLAHGTGAGLVLVVRGKRLDHRGSFTQSFSTAGGDEYPSIVKVPAAGCWQLQLTSGTKRGRVAFLAVKPVSAPRR